MIKLPVANSFSAVLVLFAIFLNCDKRELRETKYDNGQLKSKYYAIKNSEGNYVNDGPFTSWYENGQKKSEGTYKDGKFEGLITIWHENGQKKQEGIDKNGKFDGIITTWYDNGQKESVYTYTVGNGDGPYTLWYGNGQKQQEGTFKDGKLEGLNTSWYENGQKKEEITFKDGIIIDNSATSSKLSTDYTPTPEDVQLLLAIIAKHNGDIVSASACAEAGFDSIRCEKVSHIIDAEIVKAMMQNNQ